MYYLQSWCTAECLSGCGIMDRSSIKYVRTIKFEIDVLLNTSPIGFFSRISLSLADVNLRLEILNFAEPSYFNEDFPLPSTIFYTKKEPKLLIALTPIPVTKHRIKPSLPGVSFHEYLPKISIAPQKLILYFPQRISVVLFTNRHKNQTPLQTSLLSSMISAEILPIFPLWTSSAFVFALSSLDETTALVNHKIHDGMWEMNWYATRIFYFENPILARYKLREIRTWSRYPTTFFTLTQWVASISKAKHI